MGAGQQHQPRHLVDQLRVDVGGLQLRSCQRGRSFLVVGLSGVHRVVEPRRQLGRLGVVAVLGQQPDGVEHLAQVPFVVVPAVRLAPAVEQILRDLRRQAVGRVRHLHMLGS